MTYSLVAFFIGAGLAVIIYLATRFVLGDRADHLIGGAAPIAFFVSPWWAALAGAVLGHVLAVIVMRKLLKQQSPRYLANFGLIVLALYSGYGMYNFNSVTSQVKDVISDSSNKSWAIFASGGEANRFVFENFRPCVEAKSFTLLSVNAKHAPSVCRSSAVSLAATTRGSEFGQAVDAAIVSWNSTKSIDSGAKAKIQKLIASI